MLLETRPSDDPSADDGRRRPRPPRGVLMRTQAAESSLLEGTTGLEEKERLIRQTLTSLTIENLDAEGNRRFVRRGDL